MNSVSRPRAATLPATGSTPAEPERSEVRGQRDGGIRTAHIRSFSGRRGHVTAGQRQAYERLAPHWVLPWRAAALDRVAAFGREASLVLEIGFGMGETTALIAQARPETDFLAVEVYPAGVGSLLRRIDERGLTNIRIVQHDAVEVVREMLAPSSLTAAHIFFPDPWPKTRHHKRRLIQAPFVSLLASRLAPGAILHCATDWEHYAVQMLRVLSAEPTLNNTVPAPDDRALALAVETGRAPGQGYAARPAWRPLTKFESRGVKLGYGVWDLLFERR